MTGCAAIDCSNSSEKGFLMKRFPRDPERRKLWQIKTRRDKWTPTDNSYLCEVHFAAEMWEKTREDGTRKLKMDAVPTIFSFSSEIKQSRKPPKQRSLPIPEESKPFEDNLNVPSVEPMDIPDISAETSLESQFAVPCTSTSDQADLLSTFDSSSGKQDSLVSSSDGVKHESKYKIRNLKLRAKVNRYKRLLRNSQLQLKNLRKKKMSSQPDECLRHLLFNQDQIEALRKRKNKKSTKFMKWSNETITKSLKLKFSCGNNGFNELMKQGFPLPSVRTLQRRLQDIKFDSGILEEVFSFLEIKVQNFETHEKDCVLVLDEMAITPGYIYDTSLNKYFGKSTLPHHHTETATHVLVFMLGGISTRWKQIVAYYFTSDSVDGAVFKEIIEIIIQKAEKLNLNVISITSDMGSSNQALWRTWGISAGKHTPLNCRIPHPIKPDEFIYFFADVPHLFKNIKGMIVQNKIVRLPPDIVEKHNLPSSHVLSSHFNELIAHQESHIFKLAPKLTESDLLPTHFSKMKVKTSSNVVSHSVSSALKFLAEALDKPEYMTTAWFLDQIEKWFYLMTSRHPSAALSKFNMKKHNDSIQFLKDFIYLFSNIEVGYKKLWKPSQTGVRLSTQSMIDIQDYLLESKNYNFVLTSRFSQDCLENLFCVLRSKQIVPNAVQVKNNLKLICISQYLKNPKSGSYDEDDREFLAGFLDTTSDNNPTYDTVQLPSNVETPVFNPSYSELNSMYNVCGYILQSIMKTSKTCKNCIAAAGSKTPIYDTFTRFTQLKRFREHTLFFCNEALFYFFLEMEHTFRKYISIVFSQNVDLKKFYFNEMSSLSIDIPNCHTLKDKIINRFVVFRLKINKKKTETSARRFASKSIAGHSV